VDALSKEVVTVDHYFIGGIACGVAGIAALVWISLYHARARPSLAEAIVVFLTSFVLVAGIKVCVLALNPAILTEVENERVYVFLGGIAVIWVSIDSVWTTLSAVYRQSAE